MATVDKIASPLEWRKITNVGESGTCWKKTGGQVVVDHTENETAATLPLSNVNVTVGKSKRVPLDEDSNDVLGIPSDGVDDVYYVLSLSGAEEKIAVDVI